MNENDLNFPILAHMTKEEVAELSRAQGGLDTNNPLKIPQFFKLGELIENKEVRQFVGEAFEGYLEASKNEKSEVLHDLDSFNDQTLGDELSDEEIDKNISPEGKALGSLGIEGDTDMVILPKNLFDFLWDLLPPELRKTNPNTGAPMFFLDYLGKALGGIIGGAIGFFTGGPVGALAGASAGLGLAGTVIDSFGNNGSTSGGGGDNSRTETMPLYSNGQRHNMVGSSAPTTSGPAPAASFPGSESNPFLSLLNPFLNSINNLPVKRSNPTNLAEQAEQVSSPPITPSPPLAHPTSSIVDRPASPFLPNDLSTIGSVDPYASPHLYDEIQRKHQLDLIDHYQKKNEARQDHIDKVRKYHFDVARAQKGAGGHLYDGYRQSPMELKEGGEVRHLKPITTNMLVSGKDGGQEDNLMVDLPVGTRVFDARTVSDIGDGNTEAGAKRLLDFFNQMPVKKPKRYTFAPCAISAGEIPIMPEYILSFGEGDLSNGHKKCDDLVKDLRVFKKNTKHTIPKKLNSLEQLLRR